MAGKSEIEVGHFQKKKQALEEKIAKQKAALKHDEAQLRALADQEQQTRQAVIGKALADAGLALDDPARLLQIIQVGDLAWAAGLGQWDADVLALVLPDVLHRVFLEVHRILTAHVEHPTAALAQLRLVPGGKEEGT